MEQGLTSHVWEPTQEVGERLADRAADENEGAQDKRWARAIALVKLPRDRSGNPLSPNVLAHERVASQLGAALGLSVNEVFLCRLNTQGWGDLRGSWASLHALVPEPFQRLQELPQDRLDAIWNGVDRDSLVNDSELRQIRLFDALIINGDRHAGNVLVSGGRIDGELWAYFIDHGYAFGGDVDPATLAAETEGDSLVPYIEARSNLAGWWDGMKDESRKECLPLAAKIAELSDVAVAGLVDALPEELASAPSRRFLRGVLQYHIDLIRDRIQGGA